MRMLLNNLGKFVLVYALTFAVWVVPVIVSTYTGIGPFSVAIGDQIAYGFVFVIANIGAFVAAVALTLVNWRLKGISLLQISLYSVISVFCSYTVVWFVGQMGLADFIPMAFLVTPFIVALIAYLVLKNQVVGNSA